MIIYLADRNLSVNATASTDLPTGFRILSDTKTDSIETGTKTFECSIGVNDKTRLDLQQICKVGNFLLRSAEDGNEFYTIIETELDTSGETISVYAEDAGLDLINTIVPEYVAAQAHTMSWYINHYLTSYAPEWKIGINESPSSTLTLEFEDESTLTERLLSIATSFGCEIGFSYDVNGLYVAERYVDIYDKRGNGIAEKNYYINREVASITEKKSIAELATAFNAKGGTLSGAKNPINLSGCNYSSDGTTTHDPAVATDDYQIVGKQVRCISAMAKWSSELDSDGLFVRPYQYDTTNKKTLFSHAVAELKKVKDEAITYEIEFNELPDVRVGDYINIVDDADEIYIESRVLKLEISVTDDTVSAELGEFVQRSSGISERLAQLAEQLRLQAVDATSISITSSNGVVFHNTSISTTLTAIVYYGDTTITNQTDLEDVFGAGVAVKWYQNGSLIGTGFSQTITSANTSETITAKVEV